MNSSNSDEATMTSDEMIERSTSWTLGCDNALLNRLRNISDNLEQNAEEINRSCDSLSRDVTVLQAKLFNVTNQFLMISNSQFVENRVQEFEETSSNSLVSAFGSVCKPLPKTKAEKEAELIAKMKDAIQIGVSIQEENLSSSLAPEDPSSKLCLPHLIGSSKFFSSRYVGLAVDNPRIPSRPIDDLENSLDSTEYNKPQSNMLLPDTSDTDHNISRAGVHTDLKFPYPSSNSASITPERPENNPSVISQPRPIIKPVTSRQSSSQDLSRFENSVGPPPPSYVDASDESDDDFKPPAAGVGLLFADDDDDLFNDSSLFVSKPDNNLFFGIKNATANQNQPSTLIEPPPYEEVRNKSRASNVSGGSDVGRVPECDNISAPSPLPVHPKDSHFPSRGETDTNDHNVDTSRSKIPPGGVSIFGSVPPGEITRLKNQQRSQPNRSVVENEGNVPSVIPRNPDIVKVKPDSPNVQRKDDRDTSRHSDLASKGNSQGSVHGTNPSTRSKITPASGLFDDDSDEDIFFSSKKQPSTKSALFSDNIINNKGNGSTDLLKPVHRSGPSKIKSSIFDDSDSDDDLFSSASSTTSSKTKEKKPNNIFSQPHLLFNGNNKSSKMFEDDSDADLFANGNAVDNKSSATNDRVHHSASEQQKDTSNTEPKESKMTSVNQDASRLPEPLDKTLNEEFNQISHNNSQSGVLDKPNLNKDLDSVVDANDSNCDNQTEDGHDTCSAIQTSESATSISPHVPNTPEIESKTPAVENEVPEKMPSKTVTSKAEIFEKKLSLNDGDQAKTEEKPKLQKQVVKTKVSVKALASGLNLNPLAMRPGAKAPKMGSVEKSDSIVSSGNESPTSGTPTSESPIKTISLQGSVPNSPIRTSPDRFESSQLLPNLAKGRAKIQVKRRPPSKQLLKSYVAAKEKEVEKYEEKVQEDDDKDEEESIVTSDIKEDPMKPQAPPNVVPDLISPSTEEEDLFPTTDSYNSRPSESIKSEQSEIDVVSSVFENEGSGSNPPETVPKNKNTSLWDESDSDDIFAAASVKKSKPLQLENDLFSSVQQTNITQKSKIENDILHNPPQEDQLIEKTAAENQKGISGSEERSLSPDTTIDESRSKSRKEVLNSKDEQVPEVQSESKATKQSMSKNKPTGKNLFSDDEEESDSIFSSKSKSSTLKGSNTVQNNSDLTSAASKPAKSSTKKKKGLFDSESGDSDDLFSNSSRPKIKSVSGASNAAKATSNNSVNDRTKKAEAKKGRKKSATTNSIFSDSSDDDLFAPSKSSSKKSAVA